MVVVLCWKQAASHTPLPHTLPCCPPPPQIRQLSFDYKPRFGVSPYRGVTRTGYLKPDGAQRWCARIFIDGKMKQLSADYATQEDAARAYDAKAVEIGRPRHQLNFPDEH